MRLWPVPCSGVLPLIVYDYLPLADVRFPLTVHSSSSLLVDLIYIAPELPLLAIALLRALASSPCSHDMRSAVEILLRKKTYAPCVHVTSRTRSYCYGNV